MLKNDSPAISHVASPLVGDAESGSRRPQGATLQVLDGRRSGHRPDDLLDITVLAGGPGAEREVSLNSGRAVCDALRRVGHRVELCDISPNDLSALDRPADFVFIALHGEFGEDGVVQGELDARGLRYSGSGAAASGRP